VSSSNPVTVIEAGLACCGVEASSVDLVGKAWANLNLANSSSISANILVIAGTVTNALAPMVKSAYENLSEPKVVVAFGACAITGGPYWDSYSVIPGADQIIPVNIHVPGCPPSPEELAAALTKAVELVGA
jgi:NADH-quinone oxidoreductase subunit B